MDSHSDQKHPSRVERVKLFCAFVLASLCVAVLLFQPTASSQQTDLRERKVDDKYSYNDCPIKIIGVETSKRKIVLGTPFSDDDDWMKGLTVRVANSSGKALTHVGIKIILERPPNQPDQTAAGWDLWYGVDPFSFKPDENIPPPVDPLIQPGHVQSIELSASDYGFLRAYLWGLKFPASIENIHIMVYTIGFADGTAWGGQLYKRDRGSKRGWTPAEKPKGSTTNYAVSSPRFVLASYRNDAPVGWKTKSLIG